MGRPLTAAEQAQVTQWIDWTEALIVDRLGPADALNVAVLGMVLIEVASARLRNVDGATSREVAVDDAREVTRYASSRAGLLDLLGDWWSLLAPATSDSGSGAFTVTPYGAPDKAPDAW